MIAILLYLIGFISAAVTIVVVALDAPAISSTLMTAYGNGLDAVPAALGNVAVRYGWALTPLLGGLLLMGFARIIILLGGIRRALRGPA